VLCSQILALSAGKRTVSNRPSPHSFLPPSFPFPGNARKRWPPGTLLLGSLRISFLFPPFFFLFFPPGEEDDSIIYDFPHSIFFLSFPHALGRWGQAGNEARTPSSSDSLSIRFVSTRPSPPFFRVGIVFSPLGITSLLSLPPPSRGRPTSTPCEQVRTSFFLFPLSVLEKVSISRPRKLSASGPFLFSSPLLADSRW